MYNRIRNTVDSPSGDPEIEPELANETVETTGGRDATGSRFRFIPFKLNDRRIRTRASVSPDVDETMLGADCMGEHGCLWDFKNRTITIGGSAPIPLSKRHTLRCRRVILQEDTVLLHRQQIDVVARITFSER